MNGQIEKPDYGNWTPRIVIYIPLAIALLFLASSFMWSLLFIPAVFFLLVAALLFYIRFRLSSGTRNVQESIWSFVVDHLDWSGEGRALDIGCGNGALTIKLARKYPKAQVLGIDYWGKKWDYSMSVCERNAAIEGVSDRVAFQRASAASLPFADEYFDAAVSNFVFHEVGDAKDKRDVIREALRVLKKGGRFAFQDEFLIKKMYGDPDTLITTIKSWGIAKAEFIPTRDLTFIPRLLKASFILGSMAMIQGEK